MGKEQAGQEKKEDTKEVSREERIAKIMQLLEDREKDAANIVRTWLQNDGNK